MKTTIAKVIAPALLLGAVLTTAVAANAHPYAPVNGRLENQQDRISAGVRDHQLTRREQYNLDARDSRIRTIEDRDRARDDGRLTRREHVNLERDLNHVSHSIYHDRRAGN